MAKPLRPLFHKVFQPAVVPGFGPTLSTGGGSGPAPADYVVSNDSEFAAANTAATAGKIIELADGSTFGDLTVTKTGITVRGASVAGHVMRSIYVNAAQNVSLSKLRVQPNAAPPVWFNQPPPLIAANGNVNGLLVDGCDVRGGDWTRGFVAFDPTADAATYPQFGSSGSFAAENNFFQAWYGFGSVKGSGSTITGSITIQNCTFADMWGLIKFNHIGNGGSITIRKNKLLRPYGDFISFGYTAAAVSANGPVDISGNVFADMFCQPQDNANPHGDMVQIFAAQPGYNFPIAGLLIAGNIAFQRPGARGQPQRVFMSDINDGYPFLAPRIIDNLLVSRISSKGIQFREVNTGAAWAYLYRNNLLTNPRYNAPIQNELVTNPVSGVVAETGTALSTIDINGDATYPDHHFIDGNFAEALIAVGGVAGALGNVISGRGNNGSSYATWFDANDAVWDGADTEDKIVAAMRPKTAYASLGPVRPTDTAASLLDRWGVPANRPWSQLPSFVSFAAVVNATVSTVYTSEWSFVHAFEGRSISVPAGVRYRTADDKGGTNATAWTSTAGTIADGRYLQLEVTSSASGSTVVSANVTIGGQTFTWSVTTASTAAFPVVAFVHTDPDRFAVASSGALDTADSPTGTLFISKLKVAAPPASSVTLYNSIAGSAAIAVSVLNTGFLRVLLRDVAGSTLGVLNTSINICDNVEHDILVSWDTSQALSANGAKIYVDGVDRTGAITSWAGAGSVGYTRTVGGIQMCLGGIVTGSSTANFSGQIGAFYLNTAARVDITSSSERAKFSADLIGSDGSGPTGSQPRVFLVGNAAQHNDAGGINRGTGAKYIAISPAAVTNVGAGTPWS